MGSNCWKGKDYFELNNMKYWEKIWMIEVLGVKLNIKSNGLTTYVSNHFSFNNEGIKLWMDYQCVQLGRKFYYRRTGINSYSVCKDL